MRLVLVAVLLATTVLAVAAAPVLSAEPEVIGSVKAVAGAVDILRNGARTAARPGLKLFAGDTLMTGPAASIGVVLRDDSVLSLGPASRLRLERFAFSPADGRLGFFARLLGGTLSYLSGVIARLAPESVSFETPVATVGVRGTHLAIRAGE